MPAFTDQFSRRDPLSTEWLGGPFQPWEALFVGRELTFGTPVEDLAHICRVLSDVFEQRRQVPLPVPTEWMMLLDLSSDEARPQAGLIAKRSVIFGAYALWQVADYRDLVATFPRPPRRDWTKLLSAQQMMEAADIAIRAVQACLRGKMIKDEEERQEALSIRNTGNVLSRHERTTKQHKSDAILWAVAAYRNGVKRTDAADEIMFKIKKKPIIRDGQVYDYECYEKKTILGWFKEAGWRNDKDGWPNCPDDPQGLLRP
jgi:hypothetical protein